MRERKLSKWRKFYPTYRPYPVTWDSSLDEYSQESNQTQEMKANEQAKRDALHDFTELAGDANPTDWLPSRPTASNDESAFRPLHLLQSLFADRLNFLQRAMDELDAAKQEREQMTRRALEELDSDIGECERALATLNVSLDGFESRHPFERRLFELKRERRREALLGWRDLVWLKGEIRKLQRDIETLGATEKSAKNGESKT
jgi:hypothetical protein